MAAVLGKDFKLYRNSDDPYDSSPTWVEVTNVRDFSRTNKKTLADLSTRATSYKQQKGTMKELTLKWGMVYNPADAGMTAFEDAYHDGDLVEVLVLDGSIQTAGSAGIRFMAEVSDFSDDENLEDVGTVNIEVVVGYYPDNPPRRVHVTTPGGVVDL